MEYVDITNSRTYDFLYLRIDFQNRCKFFHPSISKNLNFLVLDTRLSISLIQNQLFRLQKLESEQNGFSPFPFCRQNDNYCRNRFHSDKICDISYANIQGKESLIEKFRNSCVMDEDPSYRPKIFHSSGPLMGQEQESFSPLFSIGKSDRGRFPEPNNTRRKLRSIACARQIGLYSLSSLF